MDIDYEREGFVVIFGKFPEGIVEVRGPYDSYDDASLYTRSDKQQFPDDEVLQLDYAIMPLIRLVLDDEEE